MKKNLLWCVSTGLLGLALALVAFEQQAAAQVDSPTTVVRERDDDSFEWGLLGLAGLLGLGGLMRGDRNHTTHRDTVSGAGSHNTRT